MAEVVKLPKFGLTMQEAVVSQWSIEVGQPVAKGEVLAIIESEKVEMELPSPASGIVAEHLVDPGTTVPVGTDLAIIVADESELAGYGES